MKILDKILKEILRPRSIKISFINYETEDEQQKRLLKEFKTRVTEIRERNSKKYFENIMPIVANDFAKKNGYMPSYECVMSLCLKQFTKDLIAKKLDSLYEAINNVE